MFKDQNENSIAENTSTAKAHTEQIDAMDDQLKEMIRKFWLRDFQTYKDTILCPLIISTFSWGQKSCAYYEKSAYYERAQYLNKFFNDENNQIFFNLFKANFGWKFPTTTWPWTVQSGYGSSWWWKCTFTEWSNDMWITFRNFHPNWKILVLDSCKGDLTKNFRKILYNTV